MYNKKIPIDINCGFRIAIEVMGGKWKPYIIYELLNSAKRPGRTTAPYARSQRARTGTATKGINGVRRCRETSHQFRLQTYRV